MSVEDISALLMGGQGCVSVPSNHFEYELNQYIKCGAYVAKVRSGSSETISHKSPPISRAQAGSLPAPSNSDRYISYMVLLVGPI